MSSSYSPDSHSSSTPSVAIIIVCAVLGGVIVSFLVFRISLYMYRRKNTKSAPLPPIQPLAHHRESKWVAPSIPPLDSTAYTFHTAPPISPLRTPSDPSSLTTRPLLYSDYSRQTTPTEDWRSSVFASLSPTNQEPDYPLVPPHPLYATEGSRSSVISSGQNSSTSENEESDGAGSTGVLNNLATPVTEGDDQMRANSTPPVLTQEMVAQRRLTRQARPQSMTYSISSARTVDTGRSVRSMRSMSTTRGAPHRPHSRVEIVLPSPLAPSVYPSHTLVGQAPPLPGELAAAIAEASLRDRRTMSVCDPWLSVGRTALPVATSENPPGREKRRNSHVLDSEQDKRARSRLSRISISSTPVTNSARASILFRTSGNTPQDSSSSSRSPTPEPPKPPPVPSVPPIYNMPDRKETPRSSRSRNNSRSRSVERKSLETPRLPISPRTH